MRDLAIPRQMPAMTPAAIGMVRALEQANAEREQVDLAVDHVLHGGLYTRTVLIPAGVLLTGALIKVPTTLVIDGDATVFNGREIRWTGRNVVPASAGRKVAFVAHADTWLSMIFATEAKTREDAEREFTDEWEMLASHKSEFNSVLITGE
jgi:hypothetical protein